MRLFSLFKKNKEDPKYPWVFINESLPYWEMENPKNGKLFFLEIQNLVPQNSVLYLEGGFWRGKLKSFLEENNLQDKSKIPHGTLWPKPSFYHIPIHGENLKELSDLIKPLVYPEIAIHIHAYKNDNLLIQWYDAFITPIFASSDLPEDRIIKFCTNLNINYEKKRGST
jgi:hypothetical protein